MTDDNKFFGSHFVGSEVNFTGASPSSWILVRKISERNDQYDEYVHQTDDSPSTAWALFQCRDSNNSSNLAIMKIYMQIPFAGSEFELPEVRRLQAWDELDSFAENELTALKTLTHNLCKSTPTLLNHKKDQQDDTGLVPGGYILYLLMDELPGVRLTNFWDLAAPEREMIRQAFKVAWKDCVESGVRNFEMSEENLLWDKKHQKIYIIGFQMSTLSGEKDRWRDVLWIGWHLARASPELQLHKETSETSDTSSWQM